MLCTSLRKSFSSQGYLTHVDRKFFLKAAARVLLQYEILFPRKPLQHKDHTAPKQANQFS